MYTLQLIKKPKAYASTHKLIVQHPQLGEPTVGVYHLTRRNLISLGEACSWVLAGGYGGRVSEEVTLTRGLSGIIRLNMYEVEPPTIIQLKEEIERAVHQGQRVSEGA